MGKSSESPVICMHKVCNWLAMIDRIEFRSKYDDNLPQPNRRCCLSMGPGKDFRADPRNHAMAKLEIQDTKMVLVIERLQKAPCA